jgi:hypothetical protein
MQINKNDLGFDCMTFEQEVNEYQKSTALVELLND